MLCPLVHVCDTRCCDVVNTGWVPVLYSSVSSNLHSLVFCVLESTDFLNIFVNDVYGVWKKDKKQLTSRTAVHSPVGVFSSMCVKKVLTILTLCAGWVCLFCPGPTTAGDNQFQIHVGLNNQSVNRFMWGWITSRWTACMRACHMKRREGTSVDSLQKVVHNLFLVFFPP